MNMSTACRVAAIVVLSAFATPIVAQGQTTANLEEIVVTATKRAQTLQEIPVAVSVVQADDLKESQIQDVKDLQFLVPSLKVTQLQSSGNTNFIIRGFGNGANNVGIEPSVGVFIDGVYRSKTAAALNDLPNVERIEVLRGPQSTLFGKNASAGVISVVTAKPSLDETTGSVSLTYGDYSQVIFKGDVNGPLSDAVAAGLSVNINQRDGYYENLAGGSALGELDRWGIRGDLYFMPSDSLELRVIADFSDLDEACCGVANLQTGPTTPAIFGAGGQLVPNAPFAYKGYYDFTPVNQFESSGISAQFDWDISDAVTLTSITALRNLKRFENGDVDFTSAQLIDPDTGNLLDVDVDTLTQELRLSGATNTTNWMVGAFFFDEEIDQDTGLVYGTGFRPYADLLTSGLLNIFEALPFPGMGPGTVFAAGQGLFEVTTQDNQAISLFGQVDINLGDRTTLTLGANYTEDEKDITFDSIQTDAFSALPREAFVAVGEIVIYQGAYADALENGVPDLGIPPGIPTLADAYASGVSATLAPLECSPENPPPACNPVFALQGFQFLPENISFPNSVEPGTSKDDDTTWTARLAFDMSDDVNVYLSAATGFKASSWNLTRDSRPFVSDLPALADAGLLPPTMRGGTRYAEPEESTVYEIGMKGSWDTVALNVAVFEQELKNFQSNIFQGTGFVLANSQKRSTSGAEFDIRWQPSEAFEGTLGATFLDSKYDVFLGASAPDNEVEDLFDVDVPGVPDLSLTATGRYSFTVGNAAGYVRVEYHHEDKVQVIENTPASVASREINTVNASIGLAWENGFEAMLWGRNINNDEYLLSAFPSVAQNVPPGAYSGYPNQPRTYGLTVRKYFD
ncbi:MAG: TonB-dependent receptor [Gammaproteobacteria bacterium]|nr:TonB-dependent receptor [Gammaproteobacteria bacterium]